MRMTMAETQILQFERRPLRKISLSTEAQLQSTSRSRSRESRKGISETEGKVARVATSKLGNERVSNSTSALGKMPWMRRTQLERRRAGISTRRTPPCPARSGSCAGSRALGERRSILLNSYFVQSEAARGQSIGDARRTGRGRKPCVISILNWRSRTGKIAFVGRNF